MRGGSDSPFRVRSNFGLTTVGRIYDKNLLGKSDES